MRVKRITIKRDQEEQKAVDLSLLDPVLEQYKGKKGNLIPILQKIQDIFGVLARKILQ